ncbi:MAG: DUF2794 domain-containing protein [Rhodobacteraceae bacterium]|nr:DUF2794 domain-containing protein [Paracoccaceae bacterium]
MVSAAVVRITDYRRARPDQSFTRSELNRLLGLYATRVMRGEWRDYAINHSPDGASFFIYRSSFERPLFEISKLSPGKKNTSRTRAGRYVVTTRQEKLAQGHSLDDVLKVLERTITLVTA